MSCHLFPHVLSWIKVTIETLDITITDKADASFQYNFQQRMLNFKAILNI